MASTGALSITKYHQGSLLAPALWLFHPAYPTVSHQSLWIATIVSMQLQATHTRQLSQKYTTLQLNNYFCQSIPMSPDVLINNIRLCSLFIFKVKWRTSCRPWEGLSLSSAQVSSLLVCLSEPRPRGQTATESEGSRSHFCNQSTHAPHEAPPPNFVLHKSRES